MNDIFSKRIIKLFKREIACLSNVDCKGCQYYEGCELGGNTPYDSEYIEAYNAAIEKIEKLDKITEIINDCDLGVDEIYDKIQEVIRA